MLSTSLALRDYQSALIQGIYERWHQGDRSVLAQLPTGGGKTICFGAITQEFTRRGETVMILAHREELVIQARDKVGSIAGCPVGVIKAGHKPDYSAPIQVASVQSLVRRLDAIECPALIVVDECHHATASSYRKILGAYPDSYVLGVSATPTRLNGEGFDDIFDSLACGPTVGELIKAGHLSRFKLFADPKPMTVKGVRKTQGDYSAGDLAAANDAIALSGNLIASYREHCPGKRCVVFAVNVEHSRTIADRYNAAGIPAKHLDGNTPDDERREALAQFARGELLVLSNCALFDEGLDIPAIEAIQCAKPTASLVKWLQMVGRALRTAPGKEYAVILDHTKNWAIHGLPTRPRIWTLQGVETEQKEVRLNERNFEVTESDLIVEGEDTLEAIELSPMDQWLSFYQDLLATQQARGYKPSWIFHQLRQARAPLELWQRYAQYRGYKSGWAWHQFKAVQAVA
jgi:superfamily II DNA or RNA helicase